MTFIAQGRLVWTLGNKLTHLYRYVKVLNCITLRAIRKAMQSMHVLLGLCVKFYRPVTLVP